MRTWLAKIPEEWITEEIGEEEKQTELKSTKSAKSELVRRKTKEDTLLSIEDNGEKVDENEDDISIVVVGDELIKQVNSKNAKAKSPGKSLNRDVLLWGQEMRTKEPKNIPKLYKIGDQLYKELPDEGGDLLNQELPDEGGELLNQELLDEGEELLKQDGLKRLPGNYICCFFNFFIYIFFLYLKFFYPFYVWKLTFQFVFII